MVAGSVNRLVSAMSTNWVLLQPRLPTLVGKMSKRIGLGFNVTIIQESAALAALCKISCSSATVVNAKSSKFLQILAKFKTVQWKEYSI